MRGWRDEDGEVTPDDEGLAQKWHSKTLADTIALAGLQQEHPEARQFLHSLPHYAASPAFAPEHQPDPGTLHKILP